ncbi:MAG: hypothetical protein ACXAE3_00980 [Candidatus Kariarchaeaceae archaeon]|jgi:RNase P/RNase MRP subunit p30
MNLANVDQLEKYISVASFLNERYLLLPVPRTELPTLTDIDPVSILSLHEKEIGQNGIKKALQKNRYQYDLIEVIPKSAGTASFAVQDNRVDLIRLNPALGLKVINSRYANRLVEESKIAVLDLKFLKEQNSRDMRTCLRYVATFGSKQVKYLLTMSGNGPEDLRSYRGLQALGRYLGISNKATSESHVMERIERNRKKIDGTIPFEGVEVHGSED